MKKPFFFKSYNFIMILIRNRKIKFRETLFYNINKNPLYYLLNNKYEMKYRNKRNLTYFNGNSIYQFFNNLIYFIFFFLFLFSLGGNLFQVDSTFILFLIFISFFTFICYVFTFSSFFLLRKVNNVYAINNELNNIINNYYKGLKLSKKVLIIQTLLRVKSCFIFLKSANNLLLYYECIKLRINLISPNTISILSKYIN